MALTPDTITQLKGIGLTADQIKKFEALKAARVPATAKLSNMGFDPKAVAKLPASVQNLQKSDLLALGGWGGKLSPAGAKISVTDVQKIKDVLGPAIGGINPVATDINCCCCPCCCAASIPEPIVIEKTASFSPGLNGSRPPKAEI